MILYGCPLFGCATLFNRAARERLLPYPGGNTTTCGRRWSSRGRTARLPPRADHSLPPTRRQRYGSPRGHRPAALPPAPRPPRETVADQLSKLRAFRQLPYAVSIPKIVGMKLLKCLKTLLKDPDHGKPDGSH